MAHIRVGRVMLARGTKTLLGPRSRTHRTNRARDREGSRDRCACKKSRMCDRITDNIKKSTIELS